MNTKKLIDKLEAQRTLPEAEWLALFDTWDESDRAYAAERARRISLERFGNKVYIRGIVEFSNVCKNDCYYCGIRASNRNALRYRLTEEEILSCCAEGYCRGFRTFVLQSGEDYAVYPPERLAGIVRAIKSAHPDCAVTLSVGELEYDALKLLREAGADRYLLRHETADREHYSKLHPEKMSFDHRMKCLRDLKSLGFQTGAGIMVGSPYQTNACLAKDMLFLAEFQPEMIGIGPFLPHKDTPFRDRPKGSYELTLFLLSLCRLMLPRVLLPATTALGTIRPDGREQGILSGANVIMPNLSPEAVRKKYMLYDGKETGETVASVRARMESIGYEIEITRGDFV